MSFRTRLTSFFVLIVVVPIAAVGVLVFRLIDDSAQGKADARASGLVSAAESIYRAAGATARVDAQTIARDGGLLSGPSLSSQLAAFAAQAGLSRVQVRSGSRVIADVGDRAAIAPGSAVVRTGPGGQPLLVTVSSLPAREYVRELAGPPAVQVLVRIRARIVPGFLPRAAARRFPHLGTLTLGGISYRAVTQTLPGFPGSPVALTILSDPSVTAGSVGSSRALAVGFLLGFLLLALSFSVLASRALHGQLGRFLQAAKRLAGGDFSSPIETQGHDEFAALGDEFNNMSSQLAHRLAELSEERERLQESLRRIGLTFASNLDRPTLLELALKTAADAVQAGAGRVSARAASDEPLAEAFRVGSLSGLERGIHEAECSALHGGFGESGSEGWSVASVALGSLEPDRRAAALMTVCRHERPFDGDDRDMLRSLAAQATLALENVDLHFQVRRQAVTDELTGLANHRRFQDVLSGEMEQVRRYHYPIGLIMLDIDDFKSVNDSFGHQQGDVVLSYVAKVLRDTSREADAPARYGGEEMALILPHTDLEGSYVIAERLRSAIESLRIPRLDQHGALRVTASLGVAAGSGGDKDVLIADADAALYAAKRQGKNRTVRARVATANVFSGQ